MNGINRGITFVFTSLSKRKNEIKGINRGITFVLTACLSFLLLKSQTGWPVAVVGGLIGFFAYYGW